jgi:hypothetical protein
MSYDAKNDKITVNDVTYDVHRQPDRGSPEETLTLRDFDVESDEFFDPFPGLSATLGMEESIESHDSPRQWSNVGRMAVSYRGYDLGDEDISKIDFDVTCNRCEGQGERPFIITTGTEGALREVTVTCAKCEGEGVILLNPVDYFKTQEGATVVLPLIVYEHSGITIRVGRVGDINGDSAGWDTSFVGFIYDTPEGVKQCIGDDANEKEIEDALRSEVEVYASYLEGDVTFYSVSDEETDYDDYCGGFVGAADECESQCFASLETAIVQRLAEEAERSYWKARDVQTI